MVNRRAVLAGGGAALLGSAAVWGISRPAQAETELTPPQAREAALAGEIVLVDIRRPDEWSATGVAEGAVPLDMRQDDFVERLRAAASGRPVAVICAGGVRSRRVTERLSEAGVQNVIDVPEGMLGSRAGPGWIERGLPVVQVSQ
ncbi:rhodanese-like domain-containing protein [Aestuariibius insulae]|uniref:rhodanese-like domain-containing protein n=1 Tax=Aestuariibius insulae TaxID=2058287 RepID=UPI00345EC244